MKIKTTHLAGLVAATSMLLLGTTACGSDDSSDSSDSMGSSAMSAMTTTSTAPMNDSTMVGPGCASYAETVPDGPGSVVGMAQDPVAVAASNNPLLKTLTAAVSGELNPDVNLVDTLNGGEFTVFAPVDDAFAKIDPATIDQLRTDDALLTQILTYHVVPGRLAPSEVDGEHTTVEGSTLTVAGSGDNLTVNDSNVICGGVNTANSTVYLIDTVLMPQ